MYLEFLVCLFLLGINLFYLLVISDYIIDYSQVKEKDSSPLLTHEDKESLEAKKLGKDSLV